MHAALIPVGRNRLMIDRFRQPMRDDGFNPLRAAPDHAMAGTAARWRAPLEAMGLEPATLIDALPFWDGWTQATLHGTTLVAVLRDPRDLLLNWMAWGSAAGFAFPRRPSPPRGCTASSTSCWPRRPQTRRRSSASMPTCSIAIPRRSRRS